MENASQTFFCDGEYLRALRVIHGISQEEMARKLKMGRVNYLRNEKNITRMSFELWIDACELLEISPLSLKKSSIFKEMSFPKKFKIKKSYLKAPMASKRLFNIVMRAIGETVSVEILKDSLKELGVNYEILVNSYFQLNYKFLNDLIVLIRDKHWNGKDRTELYGKVALNIYRVIEESDFAFRSDKLKNKKYHLENRLRIIFKEVKLFEIEIEKAVFDQKNLFKSKFKVRKQYQSTLQMFKKNDLDIYKLIYEFLRLSLKSKRSSLKLDLKRGGDECNISLRV